MFLLQWLRLSIMGYVVVGMDCLSFWFRRTLSQLLNTFTDNFVLSLFLGIDMSFGSEKRETWFSTRRVVHPHWCLLRSWSRVIARLHSLTKLDILLLAAVAIHSSTVVVLRVRLLLVSVIMDWWFLAITSAHICVFILESSRICIAVYNSIDLVSVRSNLIRWA